MRRIWCTSIAFEREAGWRWFETPVDEADNSTQVEWRLLGGYPQAVQRLPLSPKGCPRDIMAKNGNKNLGVPCATSMILEGISLPLVRIKNFFFKFREKVKKITPRLPFLAWFGIKGGKDLVKVFFKCSGGHVHFFTVRILWFLLFDLRKKFAIK